VVFGATVLALASALPEISSGIEAVRLGDHQLAMGDIFGGNAFQLCLFVVADLVAGETRIANNRSRDCVAGLTEALVLTVVYVGSVIVRPSRPHRLEPASILALLFYVVGIIGLIRIVG